MNKSNADYGPLKGLIGTWKGDKGKDISPEPDGTEENPYYETITFDAGGDVTNAETQTLMVVPYRQVVQRKSDDEVFHHQVGYWLWEPATKGIIQSVNIPRAVSCLAGGTFEGDTNVAAITLEVASRLGDPDWGIIQSPFMRDKASTEAFENKMSIAADELRYFQATHLNIYGRIVRHKAIILSCEDSKIERLFS